MSPGKRPSLLITGASGRIGRVLVPALSGEFDLRLMVLDANARGALEIASYGSLYEARLEDRDAIDPLFEGIDTVLHLAADPDPSAAWESLLANNITGTQNVFAAAMRHGCRRIIFASSIHVVLSYPPGYAVRVDDPVNPGSLYGVSKCFGEALGRHVANSSDLSVLCLRIGAFAPPERLDFIRDRGLLDAWISPRDLTQLIQLCLRDNRLQFAIVHAISDNRIKRLDISDACRELGYAPVDDAYAILERLSAQTGDGRPT